MRKPAETEVPMMPPILLNAPNLELMAEAVAATTTEVMTTILMEEEEVRKPCQQNRRIVQHVISIKDS